MDPLCKLFWKTYRHHVYYHHALSPLRYKILCEQGVPVPLCWGKHTTFSLSHFLQPKAQGTTQKATTKDSEKWTKRVNCGGESKLKRSNLKGWISQVVLFPFTLDLCHTLTPSQSSTESNGAVSTAAWTAKSSNETLSFGLEGPGKGPLRARVCMSGVIGRKMMEKGISQVYT